MRRNASFFVVDRDKRCLLSHYAFRDSALQYEHLKHLPSGNHMANVAE